MGWAAPLEYLPAAPVLVRAVRAPPVAEGPLATQAARARAGRVPRGQAERVARAEPVARLDVVARAEPVVRAGRIRVVRRELRLRERAVTRRV